MENKQFKRFKTPPARQNTTVEEKDGKDVDHRAEYDRLCERNKQEALYNQVRSRLTDHFGRNVTSIN